MARIIQRVGLVVALVALGVASVVASPLVPSAGAAVDPSGFVGLSPARLLDTRAAGGCVSGTRDLTVGGAGGVAPDAVGVVLNVTVTEPGTTGYLTVYPSGAPRPTASNLNYLAGETVPNAVTVKLGTSGRISIYSNSGCPHVIVDVVGYYRSGAPHHGGFVGITPARLLDTRSNGGCVSGEREFTVTGVGGVDAAASGVVLNVTVTEPGGAGYLTAYQSGVARPTASNLNYVAGQTVPNAVTLRVGSGGRIVVFANNGCPQVVVDVVGYFHGDALSMSGGFQGMIPTRVVDTREDDSCLDGEADLRVAGIGGVHPGAGSLVLNVTVVDPDMAGYLTVFPAGVDRPTASNLNYRASQTVANAVTVKAGPDGIISLYASNGCPYVIVDVVGSYSATVGPATAIGAGDLFSCAIVDGGQVACWGSNVNGRLGNGTEYPTPRPYVIPGLTGVTDLAVGRRSACVIATGATVWCWGDTPEAWISDPAHGLQPTPVAMPTLTGATSIDVGNREACAAMSDGTVRCWGWNLWGALGNGTTISSATPVSVVSLSGVVEVSVGDDVACGRTIIGTVYCWGANGWGEVGNGSIGTSEVFPALVQQVSGATAISVGGVLACAIVGGGAVKCWGGAGLPVTGGTPNASGVANDVSGITGATSVSVGEKHTCATLGNGDVSCWGFNDYGVLGVPDVGTSLLPRTAAGISGAVAVAAGPQHNCAISTGGSVACWGRGSDGQLGNGASVDSLTPVGVAGVG